MENKSKDGSGRQTPEPDQMPGHDRHHRGAHHRRRGRRAGRLFDYGELRTLILAMIARKPSHGYELIKVIEERMGGHYSPSPGVIYPTLSWLEDMGYAVVQIEETARKRYRITAEGEAFLTANRAAVDELLTREGEPDSVPEPLIRAIENLKLALRLRLRRGPIEEASARAIAAALDEAALMIERC